TAIAAVSANDVWVVGYYAETNTSDTQALTMHWDGNNWAVIPSPNPAGSYDSELYSVDALASNDVWATGRWYGNTDSISTLAMYWDGMEWSIVSTPNPGSYNSLGAIAASAHNDVWALGSVSGPVSGTLPMAIHWDGSSWSINYLPTTGTSTSYFGLEAISANDIWAVGVFID